MKQADPQWTPILKVGDFVTMERTYRGWRKWWRKLLKKSLKVMEIYKITATNEPMDEQT